MKTSSTKPTALSRRAHVSGAQEFIADVQRIIERAMIQTQRAISERDNDGEPERWLEPLASTLRDALSHADCVADEIESIAAEDGVPPAPESGARIKASTAASA